jgi:hypothetical protein
MILGLLPSVIPSLIPPANAAYRDHCNHGTSALGCVFLHPGIEDSWNLEWSHTLGTLWNSTAAVHDFGQKQQVFDKYLDYAILGSSSDSVGDLQFDIFTVIDAYTIKIYVPPEFQWLAPTKMEALWTDMTNDYEYLYISTATAYDSVAPGWTVVSIGGDLGNDNALLIPAGQYHVRLFNLRAPEAAGLYHFKIWYSPDGVTSYSIGAENYPIIIVKNELNPAWVEVTVRTDVYNARPFVSGHVVAEGTTPEGRSVSGVAYWGPMEWIGNSGVAGAIGALYRTYLFGLAAGTYTITAEASGFNPTMSERITINAGQSYHMFLVIGNSPTVCVTVWSKHGTGALPWNNLWQLPYGTNNPDEAPDDTLPWRDILLELYDSNNALIGFWASNVLRSNYLGFGPSVRHSPALYRGAASMLISGGRGIPLSNWLVGLHDEEAPHPTKTSYYACLQDNVDLYYPSFGGSHETRMYPSTHWDGHVPWDTADYIAGFPKSEYTLEAFVTGYIMDEADAYQRSFTITGSPLAFQMDLRRSNWIETVMHLPANTFVSVPTTVTLTAEDVGGNERAAIAFTATTAMTTDGKLDGTDGTTYYNTKYPTNIVAAYAGGLVIEGWNGVFPNIGGRSAARELFRKDYGLNPTASTHSAGAVELAGNPYTLKLFMADMGYPYNPPIDSLGFPIWNATGWYNILGLDPQVSVFLCNSPQLLSFSIVNAKVWISIRSVDFEVPAHSRPWIFPGSEMYVDFVDTATGDVVDTLDPAKYGLIQDPGMFLATADITGHHFTHNPLIGWQIKGIDYTAAHDFGFPAPYNSGYSFGVTPYDIDYVNAPGQHEHLGVWFFGNDYTQSDDTTSLFNYAIYRAMLDLRPTRLPPGEYSYDVYTHGYIMRRSFPMQVPLAGAADIEADMIEGGQIRVCMDFLHEGIQTNFNGWVRVEVFNANGDLVGASIYGQAEPNIYKRQTIPAGYGTYFAYDPIGDNKHVAGPAQAAGLGYTGFNNYTFPSFSNGQRAYVSSVFYGAPEDTWSDWAEYSDSQGNRLVHHAGDYSCFDVYGFYWYFGGPARTWAGGWPTTNGFIGQQRDYGLKGSVDIPGWEGSGGGLYSVKVWAFDPMGPNGAFEASGATDDWRMYSMGWELTDIQVPWEGAVSVFVSMNNMASLRGTIRWFDMFGNLRPLPWAEISATNPDTVAYSTGNGAVGAGSSDSAGAYLMWLPAGSHDVSISTSEAPGAWSSSAPTQNAAFTAVLSDGWVGGGDAQLSASGLPVPELPSFAAPLAMFALIAASVWLLRKRNLNAPLLMK